MFAEVRNQRHTFYFVDKKVLISNDMPEKMSLTIGIDLLKSMTEGNHVNIARKNKLALQERWKIPSFFISNFLPDYNDGNGAVSKRLAIFVFRTEVLDMDSGLSDRIIEQELVAILYKALNTYRNLTVNSTFEHIRPEYFNNTSKMYEESVNNIYQFFQQTDQKDKLGNVYKMVFEKESYTLMSDLEKRYKSFIEYYRYKSTWTKGDFTSLKKNGLVVEKKKICKSCHKIAMKGCCTEFNRDTRVTKYIVKGIKFEKIEALDNFEWKNE